MASRASTGPETTKKKFFQSRNKKQADSSGHRSTISRISGLFYSKVLVLGGEDTPPTGSVIEEVRGVYKPLLFDP